jgi:O-antigen/teichoic acid export membrane protein
LVTLPICVGFLTLGRQFITLWVGEAYAASALFLMILTIPQFASMPQYVSALVLAGMARHQAFAYFALAEGLANVLLSVVLVQRLGLIGVAWAAVITHVACTTLVVPLYTLSVLKMRVRDYVVGAYVRPLLAAIPMAALGYQFSRIEHASWSLFAFEALALCGTFAATSYFVCLDARERAVTLDRLGTMFHREAVAHES